MVFRIDYPYPFLVCMSMRSQDLLSSVRAVLTRNFCFIRGEKEIEEKVVEALLNVGLLVLGSVFASSALTFPSNGRK